MNRIPDEVIQRFASKHNVPLYEANQRFRQLENFLDKASTCVASPSLTVDEAWHEFVLHTQFYADFCMSRYGRFIHHVPTSPLCCEGECSTGINQNPQSGNCIRATNLAECESKCSTDCSSPCESK
jgi:hypothetical protein